MKSQCLMRAQRHTVIKKSTLWRHLQNGYNYKSLNRNDYVIQKLKKTKTQNINIDGVLSDPRITDDFLISIIVTITIQTIHLIDFICLVLFIILSNYDHMTRGWHVFSGIQQLANFFIAICKNVQRLNLNLKTGIEDLQLNDVTPINRVIIFHYLFN